MEKVRWQAGPLRCPWSQSRGNTGLCAQWEQKAKVNPPSALHLLAQQSITSESGARPTAMIQTDPIFLGVVPRAARSYVSQQVVCLGKPFFNACAGRFSVVEGAVKQGFPTAKVHTSDIGSFSSLIGYLADDSKRLEDLGIRILDPGLASRRIRLLFSVRLRQSSYQSRKRSTARPQSPPSRCIRIP